VSVKDFIEKTNVSIKHVRSLVKSKAYKVYYSGTGKCIITTSKNVEEISFKEKDDPEKVTLHRPLCEFKNRLPDIKYEKLIKKLKYNSDICEKIRNAKSEAKRELEQANQKAEEEGKKPQKITDILIYKKACSLVGGQCIQYGSRLENNFLLQKNLQK